MIALKKQDERDKANGRWVQEMRIGAYHDVGWGRISRIWLLAKKCPKSHVMVFHALVSWFVFI